MLRQTGSSDQSSLKVSGSKLQGAQAATARSLSSRTELLSDMYSEDVTGVRVGAKHHSTATESRFAISGHVLQAYMHRKCSMITTAMRGCCSATRVLSVRHEDIAYSRELRKKKLTGLRRLRSWMSTSLSLGS